MLNLLVASVSEVSKQWSLFDMEMRLMGGFAAHTPQGSDTNRFASSLGKLMAQQLVMQAGVRERELSLLSTGEFGKPQLQLPNIDFNVSHSHDRVVAVVSTSKSVGIDVEAIRSIDLTEYKTIFSEKEWELLMASKQPHQQFFELWTKKESLLKAYGSGLQVELTHVEVSDKIGHIKQSDKIGYFIEIAIPSYSCFVCSTFESKEIDIAWFKP